MLAFWKPYALRAKEVDEETVQAAAQTSVDALVRQVQSICDDFGLRSPLAQNAPDVELLLTALANRIGFINGGAMADSAQPVATATPLTPLDLLSVETDEELIFVDDEDLLGDLA